MKYSAASANVPADLLWGLVRNHHSFLVKRDGGRNTFSAEQANLRNSHSFKHNGFVNKKVLAVAATKRKDHRSVFSFSVKSQNALRKPTKQFKTVTAGRDLKRDFGRLAAGLKNTAQLVRPDLTRDALARFSAVHRVLTRAKANRAANKNRGSKKAAARK